jgi:hypothetical protein
MKVATSGDIDGHCQMYVSLAYLEENKNYADDDEIM